MCLDIAAPVPAVMNTFEYVCCREYFVEATEESDDDTGRGADRQRRLHIVQLSRARFRRGHTDVTGG